MKLLLLGHDCRYALEQLCLCLFPEHKPEYTEEPFTGDGVVSVLWATETGWLARAEICLDGRTAIAEQSHEGETLSEPMRRQILRQSLYLAALELLPEAPAWGALSGVRPTKLTTRHLLAGGSEETADRLLDETYFVSPVRRKLCIDSSLATVQAMQLLDARDLSVYLGIPFCPTRCAYCSFVSQAIGRSGKLLSPYLQALLKEVRFCGEELKKTGHRVRTLYIGGGTPTTLSAEQLDVLMSAIEESFDLSELLEYTVEGGRPDTLDEEKLRVIYSHGCTRISINPQTMSDDVLRAVGRTHTAEDVCRAFRQAREAGFTNINMDLIAGLPGDTPERFRDSLSRVMELGPENITVHTLARKRSSDLFFEKVGLPDDEAVGEMVDHSIETLQNADFRPYYLYRQKYMSGSFENTGWTKPGYPGLYNIYMMEEVHTILSLGSGGMSKLNLPGGKLERQHNPKYPKEYTERIDLVIDQKRDFFRALAAL